MRSTLLDAATVAQYGCFTTLPVRKNSWAKKIDACSHDVDDEQKEKFGALQEDRYCFDPAGNENVISIFASECLEERIRPITYMSEIALFHDGK
jgi:hypothetical protein